MTDSSSTSPDPRPPRAIPSGRRVAGRLWVPPSKSVSHRCFNLALLARLSMVVERPLDAEDTRLFLAALERCGFAVERRGEEVRLRPGPVPAGRVEVFCGNAGTMFRFLTATLAAVPGCYRLDGTPRLRERPVGPLVEALRRLGARIDCPRREGYAPLDVEGDTLRGGVTSLDAGQSSQYLSALLMAALAAREETTVEVAALASEPYVGVTLATAERFGGRIERLGEGAWRVIPGVPGAARVRVEGDWSAACYPAAAAALTAGEVVLAGLDAASRQGDRGFLGLLEEMGAEVAWQGEELTVRGGGLAAIEAGLSAMPDQVPTLAALAPFARGTTRITGVPHLRIKESDRLAAMASELARVGAEAEERPDGLTIPGIWHNSEPPSGPVVVDPHDDHRIAMSLALVGLRRPGIQIGSPGVVGKAYPGFWQDLESLLGG